MSPVRTRYPPNLGDLLRSFHQRVFPRGSLLNFSNFLGIFLRYADRYDSPPTGIMSKLEYVVGDATRPQANGVKILVHCVNNVGKWGRGFVVAISNRWEEPEAAYRKLFRDLGPNKFRNLLGQIQLVRVSSDIVVANLFGQDGVGRDPKPIRYEALRKGCEALSRIAKAHPQEVVFCAPRLGCGLAGGDWETVEQILEQTLATDFRIIIYDPH